MNASRRPHSPSADQDRSASPPVSSLGAAYSSLLSALMKADHPSAALLAELSGGSTRPSSSSNSFLAMDGHLHHHHQHARLGTATVPSLPHPPPWMAAMAANSIPWPFIPQV